MPWLVRSLNPPEWADIVHTNSSFFSYFLQTRKPVVVTVHLCVHNPLLTPYKSLATRLYHRLWIRPIEAFSITRAAAVTAVSHYTADRSRSVYGRDDISTIHNWIDLDVFRPDERVSPNDPFRLLFVGSLSARKGADLLPRVMESLGNNFELRYTAYPDEMPDSLPNLDNAYSIGRLDGEEALLQAYQESDALLFPTRLEGFGLAALEAQACGRPVIAFNSSSLPEIVQHGNTGFLCELNDAEGLADSARSLRADDGLWKRMSLAARFRAEQYFAEEDSVVKYIAIYRSLSGEQRRQGILDNPSRSNL